MNELMPEDLQDLVLFARVVDYGGFTHAARHTGVPQATLSRRISTIEKRLGHQLLVRTTRSVGLSQMGEKFYRHARRIIAEMDAASSHLHQLSEQPSGQLRITAPYMFGQKLIAPVLSEFAQTYPDVSIKFEFSPRRIDLIEEGFDVALRLGRLQDSNLAFQPLGYLTSGLYIGSQFKDQDFWQSDQPWPAALVVRNRQDTLLLKKGDEEWEKDIQLQYYGNDFHSILEMALATPCVTLLPNFYAREFVKQGQLTSIYPGWGKSKIEFNAVFPNYRAMMPSLRAFLEIVERRLSPILEH